MKRDVGMACQKVHKLKVMVYKPHPSLHLFTKQ